MKPGGGGCTPSGRFFLNFQNDMMDFHENWAKTLNLLKQILKLKVNHIWLLCPRDMNLCVYVQNLQTSFYGQKQWPGGFCGSRHAMMLRHSLIVPLNKRIDWWRQFSFLLMSSKIGFWSVNCTPVTWQGRWYDQLS